MNENTYIKLTLIYSELNYYNLNLSWDPRKEKFVNNNTVNKGYIYETPYTNTWILNTLVNKILLKGEGFL